MKELKRIPSAMNRPITHRDLERLKNEILIALEQKINAIESRKENRWLRTNDMIKEYGFSISSLTAKRKEGSIPYSKFEGVLFYDRKRIDQLLEDCSIPTKMDYSLRREIEY